jgi:hypothetical protein
VLCQALALGTLLATWAGASLSLPFLLSSASAGCKTSPAARQCTFAAFSSVAHALGCSLLFEPCWIGFGKHVFAATAAVRANAVATGNTSNLHT